MRWNCDAGTGSAETLIKVHTLKRYALVLTLKRGVFKMDYSSNDVSKLKAEIGKLKQQRDTQAALNVELLRRIDLLTDDVRALAAAVTAINSVSVLKSS